MSDTNADPNTWAKNLDPNKLRIWQEALEHLRHLSDEVWKGFRFFMAVAGFILIIMAIIVGENIVGNLAAYFLLVLAGLGLGAGLVGRYILKRNRVYYLEMLLKKTLLEEEFGFYGMKFSGTNSDLAFPWRLKPEAIQELKQKPEEWVKRQVRGPGTIARWLFISVEAVIAIYALMLIGLFVAWLH